MAACTALPRVGTQTSNTQIPTVDFADLASVEKKDRRNHFFIHTFTKTGTTTSHMSANNITKEQLDEMLKQNPNLKAVPNEDSKSFRETFPKRFAEGVAKFHKLNNASNDIKTPFKTKYEARTILEDLLGKVLIGRIGVVQQDKTSQALAGGEKAKEARGLLASLA